MVSGVCTVAPSTPKPPARLTAATTSRQWLKASNGNSIPNMSQIGDFMAVFTPCGSVLVLPIFGWSRQTLAHQGRKSQVGAMTSSRGAVFRRARAVHLKNAAGNGRICLLRFHGPGRMLAPTKNLKGEQRMSAVHAVSKPHATDIEAYDVVVV